MEDGNKAEPSPFDPDRKRLRREHKPEHGAGAFIREASREAGERINRLLAGPPPSDRERALIATSPRRRVELYARTLVADLSTGEEISYTLVPAAEADLANGCISLSSPLGIALFQGTPGELVRVRAPGGERPYRLLRVE